VYLTIAFPLINFPNACTALTMFCCTARLLVSVVENYAFVFKFKPLW
jgi:hypothetical protein